MTNQEPIDLRMILLLSGLLVVPFLLLSGAAALGLLPWRPRLYGRLALALVLAFTGSGHFAQTEGMMRMLPPWVPARRAIILVTGVVEWALAAALFVRVLSPWSGYAVVAFLVAVFPANVYAALERVPYGGHAAGLRYLVPRATLQALLVAWALVFAK